MIISWSLESLILSLYGFKSSGVEEKAVFCLPPKYNQIVTSKSEDVTIAVVKKSSATFTVKKKESISSLQNCAEPNHQSENVVKILVHKPNKTSVNIQRDSSVPQAIDKTIEQNPSINVDNQQTTGVQMSDDTNVEQKKVRAKSQQKVRAKFQQKVVIKKQENVQIAIKRHGNKNYIIQKQGDAEVAAVPRKKGPSTEKKTTAITLCAGCGQYCHVEDEDLLDIGKKNLETLAAETLLELQEVNPSDIEEHALLTKKGIEICDKVLQKQDVNLMNFLTNENELLAFAGVDLNLLNKLTKFVTLYEGSSNVDKFSVSARNRVVICLCKLKINLPFRCLALMFGITRQVCASYFFVMLRTLSIILDKTIHWPNTVELLKNLPECFQSFKQTRVILSRTRIETERKRCAQCDRKPVNGGKEAMSFVLGVAPSGLIIFKSNAFEAQTCDDSIFIQTDLLKHLNPAKEAIMTDKSLDLVDECMRRNITLIKAPKLVKNRNLSKTDVDLMKNISAARIHVDRSLRRFKTYKILQTKILWRISPHVDDICTIIAGIVNMRNPTPPDETRIKISSMVQR